MNIICQYVLFTLLTFALTRQPILKKKSNRSFLFNIKLYRSLVMYILLKWMWELDSHSRDRMAKSYIWIHLYGNYAHMVLGTQNTCLTAKINSYEGYQELLLVHCEMSKACLVYTLVMTSSPKSSSRVQLRMEVEEEGKDCPWNGNQKC